MKTPIISIIIPNWNGEKQLGKNLPLLAKALSGSKIKTEVIVVDDASSDNSLMVLAEIKKKKIFQKFIILKKEINRGFADSVNQGVSLAQAELVFLLNTDVVVKSGCFESLLPHFKNPNTFAVGANADWKRGVINFKNGFLDLSSAKEVFSKTTGSSFSFWVSGGHSLFRKSIWQKLGGLDLLFAPFYFEETDLCYRAWKRGYQIIWESKARVDHRHEESVIRQNFSNQKINFVAQRNQLFFIWKNIHDSKMITDHCFNLLKRLIYQPKYVGVFLTAGLKLLQILTKRRLEKRLAVLSDREVFEKISNQAS